MGMTNFSFPIHGAFDGYGRKVLWLYVDRTNNDPKVMAKYFVDCVEEVGGCPSLLRTVCETENVVIAGVRSFLRAQCDDDLAGEKSTPLWSFNWKPTDRGLVVLLPP